MLGSALLFKTFDQKDCLLVRAAAEFCQLDVLWKQQKLGQTNGAALCNAARGLCNLLGSLKLLK